MSGVSSPIALAALQEPIARIVGTARELVREQIAQPRRDQIEHLGGREARCGVDHDHGQEGPTHSVLLPSEVDESTAEGCLGAALELFLKRPEIEIHNNRSELLLRGPVVGRRAWLFAGSPDGADASAIWFSLVASCMLQGIDPMAYLRDVLPGLGKKTKSEIRALTPARWAAARRDEAKVA